MQNQRPEKPRLTPTDIRQNQARIKKWLLIVISIWTFTVIMSFYWNNQQVRSLVMDQARTELRAHFFKDLTFRQWATKHGGVYVPVTEETKPDPFVSYLPERDVTTPSGRVLTLINPALMVRTFNEMAKDKGGAQGHISSLRPINPDNKPDAWEAKALLAFEQENLEEVTEVSVIDNKPYLRLIRALKMNKKCLHCHEQQGYKEGDVSGGVSVSVPLFKLKQAADKRILQIGVWHSVLWLIGFFSLVFGSRKLLKGIEENDRAYIALEEIESRTSSILKTSLDAIITIDKNGSIIDWNEQAELIFGWRHEEIIGKDLTDFIIPIQYREMHINSMRRFIETGEKKVINKRLELSALRKDGTEFPIELTISQITVAGELAFSSFIRDISEQKNSAIKIYNDFHSQRVITSILELTTHSIPFKEKLKHALDAIFSTPWLTLKDVGMIFVVDSETNSLRLAGHRGASRSMIETCNYVKIGECHCGMAAKTQQVVFSKCVDEQHTIKYEGMDKHGHYCIPINSEDRLIGVLNLYLNHDHKKDDEEINFLKSIANTLGNIIRQHEDEEKLKHYAYYDELTDLPNRTLLINRIEHCIKLVDRNNSYLFAVLFLDLDRFKNINDSLGHTVGDQVLDAVSERLKRCVRQIDTVARLGGDEFCILLDGIDDIADAYRTASRIHQELINPIQLERHEIYTSASIGIVPGLTTYKVSNDLLRDADIAMYRAKQKGNGNTEIFGEEMHAHAVRVLEIELELRRAVENKELSIFLQPIISTKNNRLLGFESLLRWNNSKRGDIYPDEFIPIAEETGLINEIGDWVLEESCQQIKIFNDKYPEYNSLYVSVNLSPIQFLNKNLIAKFDQTMQATSFDANNLRLEVTENILMENPITAAKILQDLKSRNVRLYLDDFGTGYSSLSYLHNFPFDTLKIDKTFVSKLHTGEEHIGMIKTIIDVAKNFNMNVIAEGVETKDQLKVLESLGCTNIQGYYFARPMSIKDIDSMLSNKQFLGSNNNKI